MNYRAILAELERAVAEVSPLEAPVLLGELERVKVILWYRILTTPPENAHPEPMDTDHLLTIPEVADLLSVPRRYAYDLARRRDFPTIRIGKYVRVRLIDLREWVRRKSLDTSMYQWYSSNHERPGAVADSAPTQTDPGATRRGNRRHRHQRRSVGEGRAGDFGAGGSAGPTPGRDEED